MEEKKQAAPRQGDHPAGQNNNHNKNRNRRRRHHNHHKKPNNATEALTPAVPEVVEAPVEDITELEAELVEDVIDTDIEVVPTEVKEKSDVMVDVVGIRFKASGKTYYFDPNGITVSRAWRLSLIPQEDSNTAKSLLPTQRSARATSFPLCASLSE